ncbi:PAC2 family protein [Leucobacter edaphi]|uniref:PAC2 family protein n=1 Tax=Leucobacter edaphi TaxID=2796472 RepID=UPI0034E2E60F
MTDQTSQPRVLIVAFQGWSDAGDATTEVLQHLGTLLGAEVLHAIGSEGYVDFQVHRPKVLFDEDGNRAIEWPDTRLYGVVRRPGEAAEAAETETETETETEAEAGTQAGPAAEADTADPAGTADPAAEAAGPAHERAAAADAPLPTAVEPSDRREPSESSRVNSELELVDTLDDHPPLDRSTNDPNAELIRRIDGTPVTDLFLLAGVEPARDWQNFADEIVELVDTWAIDSVIILGAMYSDAPHSRPIVTTISSESADLRALTGAQRSDYEGPAGIATVVDLALTEAGMPPVSLWAQVPHYVHSTPSPKATLALLDKLEELLDIVIPRGDLFAQANEWESNINRIAAADDDMTRYIRRLEESRDEALAAEATGDALALEFEKFLESGARREHPAARPDEGDTDLDDGDAPDGSGTEPA